MRRAAPVLLVLATLAACGGDDGDLPRIAAATPPYGPLAGGTRITITGAGFTAGGAAPNRVLVAGREAPVVVTVDDDTLEIVIPPGEQAGDAELLVLNGNGNAHATGAFHYSRPPEVTAVSPADVLFASDLGTTVTVRGTGFLAEGAGDVVIAVDGQLAADVEVTSDTELTFTAPPGVALSQPDLELADERGRATQPRAFRYVPATRPGLLLFPQDGGFAIYLDPGDNTTVLIPRVAAGGFRFTAVVRDERGDYWAIDRNALFGRLDPDAQNLVLPVQAGGWFPSMTRVGDEIFGIERGSRRFGRFDAPTGAFLPIGDDPLPCCGSTALATAPDGTTYVTTREGGGVAISTIDRTTGVLGPAVPLAAPPGFHIEDMCFLGDTLYATSRTGILATIDPATGITSPLPVALGRASAMTVFER